MKKSYRHFNSISTPPIKTNLMVRRTSLRARPGAWSFRFQSANSDKSWKFDLSTSGVTAHARFEGLSLHPFNAVNSGSGEKTCDCERTKFVPFITLVLLRTRVQCQTEIATFRSSED
jgi:hypothetical protein